MTKLLIFAFILTLVSCGHKKTPSFELTSTGDTINLVDNNGRQQGIWLMPTSKDTVVYRNDTAYSAKNTTTGELLRFLKTYDTKNFTSFPAVKAP